MGFSSFDEAIGYLRRRNQVPHDSPEGSAWTGKERMILDTIDIRAVAFMRNDGKETLFVFIKPSTIRPDWLFWCISENQAACLGQLQQAYTHLNDKNWSNRQTSNGTTESDLTRFLPAENRQNR